MHITMHTHPFLVGTFDVVGIVVNTSSPMGLVCLFNTSSLARGRLVYLRDIGTGVTYCRVVWRSLDSPDNMSLCPSSNGPLSTGVYSVEVYAIERDGSVSSVPALAGEIVTVFGPSIVYGPSTVYGPSIVYVMSSSRTLTADQGTIVNISRYNIKVSMCSYQQNVSIHCLNSINSTAPHKQFTWLNKTNIIRFNTGYSLRVSLCNDTLSHQCGGSMHCFVSINN